MSRARELTLGTRRTRTDSRAAELRRLARAKNTDLNGLAELLDDVANKSPRSISGALSVAWELGRVRYAEETGIVLPGSHNPYLETLRRDPAPGEPS